MNASSGAAEPTTGSWTEISRTLWRLSIAFDVKDSKLVSRKTVELVDNSERLAAVKISRKVGADYRTGSSPKCKLRECILRIRAKCRINAKRKLNKTLSLFHVFLAQPMLNFWARRAKST
jgi:hypothetical protein